MKKEASQKFAQLMRSLDYNPTFHFHLTYKPLYIKGFTALLHHAARKVKVCNIFSSVLQKYGISWFSRILGVTSLTGKLPFFTRLR